MLYLCSLGYDAGCELDSIEGDGQVRTNVIMLKGVDALSTDEIFKYLLRYPPRNLEWIDDSSCKSLVIVCCTTIPSYYSTQNFHERNKMFGNLLYKL